jgi:hypothetical protein
MRNRSFILASGVMLTLGLTGPAVAQGNGAQPPSARQQLQHIHTPRSTRNLPALRKIWI